VELLKRCKLPKFALFIILIFCSAGCAAVVERKWYTRTEGVYVGTKFNIDEIAQNDSMLSVIDFPFSLIADTLYLPSDLLYLRKSKSRKMAGFDHSAVKRREDMFELYEKETGQYLGQISEEEMKFLSDHLEEEGIGDEDYYISRPVLEMLKENDLSGPVAALIESAMGDNDDVEIRFKKVEEFM
jgi:uncharacterized protein YceK